MDIESPQIPTYPYEVIRDHGGFYVQRNTALVAEVLAIKERVHRMKFNSEVTCLPKAA